MKENFPGDPARSSSAHSRVSGDRSLEENIPGGSVFEAENDSLLFREMRASRDFVEDNEVIPENNSDVFLNVWESRRELDRPLIEEAQEKRKKILESRGILQMPKQDFETYFASRDLEIGGELKQGNTGDCYLVAAIHALTVSPHFETIVRSSFKRSSDGTWEVRIPFLAKDAEVVLITQEELGFQWNKKLLRWQKGEFLPDIRPTLYAMQGKEGLRVLEAAFVKYKFGNVDRLAAEGGYSHLTLEDLGGDLFTSFEYSSFTDSGDSQTLEHLQGEELLALDYFLTKRFDPEVHLVTAYTLSKWKKLGFYLSKGSLDMFASNHAYSVSAINPESKTITLVNPWNTTKPFTISFRDFKENFAGINGVRINNKNLLDRYDSIMKN